MRAWPKCGTAQIQERLWLLSATVTTITAVTPGKNVRDAVKETDVQLYLIGNEGDGGLTALAESTGGRSLSPRYEAFELGNICNEIVREPKEPIPLGYQSTNQAKDGKWRNVA